MITKIPTRKIEFGEQDEVFVKQLAKDIGCYYLKANPRTYSLNRFKSEVQGKMGVFAWIHKEERDHFWVSTRKIWIENAKARAGSAKNMVAPYCFPKDTHLDDDSVSFDTRGNYDRTVSSLKLIHKTC